MNVYWARRVELPTREAQQTVKFALTRIGNVNAVVISRLAGGSAAAEVSQSGVVGRGKQCPECPNRMPSAVWFT